jgi:hypothetical protein
MPRAVRNGAGVNTVLAAALALYGYLALGAP